MIYESVNLKGVVYEQKQNSFSLPSITTCTGFANVGPIFYKVHSLSSEQVFNWIELNRKLVQSPVNRFYCCTVKELLFSEDFYQRFD